MRRSPSWWCRQTRSAPRQRLLRRQRFKTQTRGSPAALTMNRRRARSRAHSACRRRYPRCCHPSAPPCVAVLLVRHHTRHDDTRARRGESLLSSPRARSHGEREKARLHRLAGALSAPRRRGRGERGRQTTAIRFSNAAAFRRPRRWTSSRSRARNTYANGASVPPGRLLSAAGLIVSGDLDRLPELSQEKRAPPLATGCRAVHCWRHTASHTCPGSLRELTSRKRGKRKPHDLEPGTGPAPRRPLS